jgi:hypothetical protein
MMIDVLKLLESTVQSRNTMGGGVTDVWRWVPYTSEEASKFNIKL